MPKGYLKGARDLFGQSFAYSIGNDVLAGLNTPIAQQGQLGFQNASKYLPVQGQLVGAGLTLRQLNNVYHRISRRRVY